MRPGLAILAVILACAAPSGHAASSAAASASPVAQAGTFPCPAGPAPTVLLVQRVNPLGNDLSTFPPFRAVVTDSLRVRVLFQATCRLMPEVGTYFCPLDRGIAYHLTFERRMVPILRVTVDASGCTWLFRGNRLGGSQGYWVWFGSPVSPPLPWSHAARRWAVRFGQALRLPLSALSPFAAH